MHSCFLCNIVCIVYVLYVILYNMRILVNKMKMKSEKKLYGWLNNTIEQSRVTLNKYRN